ncbi:MAG: DUF554 domain-containing protein [Rikenellaceae bacterium]|nr:DUF554 domain-containing protein [Rikenellaceae bacterium]
MIGTFVNMATVTVGAVVGMLIGKRMPERLQEILFQALGLAVCAIGISMALESENMIISVVSIALGAATGHLIGIECGLNNLSNKIQQSIHMGGSRFTEGFVGATLLYCVGSMTILGAFEDGLGEFPRLLYTKAVIDGISAIVLASVAGIGVLFSIVPLLLYQGALTLSAEWLKPIMQEAMINEMTAVGGLMLMGIGLSLLHVKEVRTADMLPALIYAPILAYIFLC